MKNLIVVRHAKSDWNQPHGDFHRPLLAAGIKAANLVASNALEVLPLHYVIWSSPASRAMQTASIFAERFSYAPEDIILKEELYTFDGKDLEKVIRSCDNLHDCLMVFAHNEAITDVVNKFGDIFIDNVPTSGFVSIIFDTNDWSAIHNGTVQKVIFPRDLKS